MMTIFLLLLPIALIKSKSTRRMKCLVSSSQFMIKMWKLMVFQRLDLMTFSLFFSRDPIKPQVGLALEPLSEEENITLLEVIVIKDPTDIQKKMCGSFDYVA